VRLISVLEANYSASMQFTQKMETGNYSIAIRIKDGRGNLKELNSEDLEALGYPGIITVTKKIIPTTGETTTGSSVTTGETAGDAAVSLAFATTVSMLPLLLVVLLVKS
jgi:hypothetical protein